MATSSRGTVTKKVLVELGEDSLPVSFVAGFVSNYESAKEAIAIKAKVDAKDLVLKVKSEEFGGRWVNLDEGDSIEDKSVIMCIVRTSKVWSVCTVSLKVKVWWICLPISSPRAITPSANPPTATSSADISATAVLSTKTVLSGTTHTQMRLSFSQENLQLRPTEKVWTVLCIVLIWCCIVGNSLCSIWHYSQNAEIDAIQFMRRPRSAKSSLNDYQKRINQASLCVHNPSLLLGKKVFSNGPGEGPEDGYNYKKVKPIQAAHPSGWESTKTTKTGFHGTTGKNVRASGLNLRYRSYNWFKHAELKLQLPPEILDLWWIITGDIRVEGWAKGYTVELAALQEGNQIVLVF